MAKYAVTLVNGDVVDVFADDEASALAHAKAVADSHAEPIFVGPKSEGLGQPIQLHRDGDILRRDREQPVSAVRVK